MVILLRRALPAAGCIAAVACLFQPVFAEPRRHQQYSGDDVAVDWVHIEGHFGDNATMRARLVANIANCVRLARESGRPHEELTDDQIPKIVHRVEIDQYMASNRYIGFDHGIIYGYHPGTCGLRVLDRTEASLISRNGQCTIHMDDKIAGGQCDAAAHARAPQLHGSTDEDIAQSMPWMRPHLTQPTGIRKRIAGLECEIYTLNLPGFADTRICHSITSTFPHSPGGGLGIAGGIDLERTSRHELNVVATEVGMNIRVSNRLFAVPPGFTVRQVDAPRPR